MSVAHADTMKAPEPKTDRGLKRIQAALDRNKEAVRSGREPTDSAPTDWVSLCALLGISKQAAWQWKRVPVEHVFAIEALFGIPREIQRPDVFKPKPSQFRVRRLRPTRGLIGTKKARRD
jgi:hypothetical protein